MSLNTVLIDGKKMSVYHADPQVSVDRARAKMAELVNDPMTGDGEIAAAATQMAWAYARRGAHKGHIHAPAIAPILEAALLEINTQGGFDAPPISDYSGPAQGGGAAGADPPGAQAPNHAQSATQQTQSGRDPAAAGPDCMVPHGDKTVLGPQDPAAADLGDNTHSAPPGDRVRAAQGANEGPEMAQNPRSVRAGPLVNRAGRASGDLGRGGARAASTLAAPDNSHCGPGQAGPDGMGAPRLNGAAPSPMSPMTWGALASCARAAMGHGDHDISRDIGRLMAGYVSAGQAPAGAKLIKVADIMPVVIRRVEA